MVGTQRKELSAGLALSRFEQPRRRTVSRFKEFDTGFGIWNSSGVSRHSYPCGIASLGFVCGYTERSLRIRRIFNGVLGMFWGVLT